MCVYIMSRPLHVEKTCKNLFSGVRGARSFVFCAMLCRSLFVLLSLFVCVLLRFTASNYPFGIFKLLGPNITEAGFGLRSPPEATEILSKENTKMYNFSF